MPTETTPVHVIGKCPVKGCKTRKRHTFTGRVERTRYGKRTHWGIPTSQGEAFPSGVWALLPPSRSPEKYGFVVDAMRTLGWVCTDHDRYCKPAVVEGVVNTEKKCNARCEAATGPTCECACGGELHGAAYS